MSNKEENRKARQSVKNGLSQLMLQDVPSYANKFIYSLGLLTATSFVLLLLTGAVMTIFGPNWWLTSDVGHYVRSVHLWATQAFVVFMILHLIIVFFSSGFRGPRKLTWVIGALMFLFVLAEAEFGYVLRGDFSAQYRSLQGADFYNGTGLGNFINNLNTGQIFGIHVAAIPLLIIVLLMAHYFLVKVLGIAKPYRSDAKYEMTKARHGLLFARAGILVIAIGALAALLPSPYLAPLSIGKIANEDPNLIGKTIVGEFDKTSETATYKDNIDPYTFDTKQVYVVAPYNQLVAAGKIKDKLAAFQALPEDQQVAQLKKAAAYYEDNKSVKNPNSVAAIAIVNDLVMMSKSGLYESSLKQAGGDGYQSLYPIRFISDTGAPGDTAEKLNMTTEQYGMVRDESGSLPPGAWWLAPLGLLNHTVLANDENGDRDGAIILGSLVFLLIAFPFIPYVNQLPDKLKVHKLIWK